MYYLILKLINIKTNKNPKTINGLGICTLSGKYNIVLTNSTSVYYPTHKINPVLSKTTKFLIFNFFKYLDTQNKSHYYKNVNPNPVDPCVASARR